MTVSMLRNHHISISFTIILCFFLSSVVQASAFKDQTEIPRWAEDSIELVRDESIMTGYGDGTFRPEDSLNRAQALTVIFRVKKINTDMYAKDSANNFRDIDNNTWFRNAVAGAVKKGWATGDPDGNFRPERTLNRAEWATLLMRAFELKVDEDNLPSFIDVPSSVWFSDSVFSMYNHGLIRYPKAKNFDPTRAVTRAEAAWTIGQILNKPALMGTAAERSTYEGYRVGNNRRVAIKPRDLNVDRQGVEETRKDLTLTTFQDNKTVTLYRNTTWTSMGSVKITNPFDNEVDLNTIEFALRFDKSVGPSQGFMIQIANAQFAGEEIFSRTGRVMFLLKDTKINANDAITFKVNVRPKDESQFFAKTGNGKVSLHKANATMWVDSTGDGRNYNISRFTPITFENRDLKEFTFTPKNEE